ncbi:trypsin-like serine protease [Streptomyces sp. NPDC057193]|uniref:trypsin-like serine protease n=1 Tax=Streptomyces sp. NPDC057193 TaxID=3346043 RepID=UPI00362707D6
MPAHRPRPVWVATALATTVAAALLTGGSASAVVGTPAPDGQYTFTARVQVGEGDSARACSGVLVAAQWVLTAAGCFADTPGAPVPAGKPAFKSTATLGASAFEVTEITPRPDRDMVLAKLAQPTTGISPVKLAPAAPPQGAALSAAGFGRTKTEWVPGKLHTGAFDVVSVEATTMGLDAKADSGATICKGDAGGPVLNAAGELVALSSRSWQAGCLGADPAETRTGAIAVRTDGLDEWILQTRVLSHGWKTETVIQSGSTLYQGIRLADGTWTGFADVQTKASDIGGIRTAAAAGISGDTHVLAIATDGSLQHTVRKADGTWTKFGNVGDVAGHLGSLTQVAAVSIGNDLHVVAVANGKVFHTTRNALGQWKQFGDVAGAAGPISVVTHAAAASVGGALQVVTVSGGKAYHTLRNTAGQWSLWGNVAQAAGTTGPITGIAIAGIEGDAHVVVATDNGTRQYHAIRKASASWDRFGELTGYLGNTTAKSLSAAHVDGELQLAVVTADGKVVHTVRHADRTWTTTPVTLQGVTGTLGAVSVTGTL